MNGCIQVLVHLNKLTDLFMFVSEGANDVVIAYSERKENYYTCVRGALGSTWCFSYPICHTSYTNTCLPPLQAKTANGGRADDVHFDRRLRSQSRGHQG